VSRSGGNPSRIAPSRPALAARALAVVSLLGLAWQFAADAARAAPGQGPYFSAPFQVRANSFNFGQTPTWTRDGRVLSNEPDASGTEQVYRSQLNGRGLRCLSCARLPGPNGFPAERPQGDWILFCSMGAQPQHFGAPCLGGYGSDLYVMRPDGSHVTRLTRSSDPANGARYDNRPDGVPYDNYHPYWSPDGRHIVWTRAEAHPLSQGGQRWEMLLADFVTSHGDPRLAHVRVVGPAFGVYETQAWAPDGSGFLFTAFGPRSSPFQATPPGWMNLELYFMRLYGRGASPEHPLVTHITDNDPTYEEQAVFTPDMRDVIVMTSRAQPGTWYQTIVTAAQWLDFDAPYPGSAGTPMFLLDFSDPRFTADLYMVDIATGAVRRLTRFNHVIPEFGWDASYSRLLWTENVRSGGQITRVGRFAGIGRAQRRVARRTPPGLFGAPIDMGRVAGALTGRLAAPRLPRSAQPPFRSGRTLQRDQQTVPPVTITYLTLLFGQLNQLASLAAGKIGQAPL
jgi:hypothetical protein